MKNYQAVLTEQKNGLLLMTEDAEIITVSPKSVEIEVGAITHNSLIEKIREAADDSLRKRVLGKEIVGVLSTIKLSRSELFKRRQDIQKNGMPYNTTQKAINMIDSFRFK